MSTETQIDTPNPGYTENLPRWRKINTLYAGTEAMRKAGETYLPRYSAESLAAWEARRKKSVLYNGVRKAVRALTGQVFRRPIVVGEDTPPQMVEYLKNVDRQGTDVNMFSREVFKDALRHGLTHILVEYPNVPDGERTVADDRRENIRPYWINISGSDLFAWKGKTENSEDVLEQVRFYETVYEEDSRWGNKEITQIRVLEPGRWEIWRRTIDPNTKQVSWQLYEQGTNTLSKIGLVTIYLDRTGLITAQPPLEDLGDLNICHWQSYSDQRNILTFTRFPLLAGAGVNEDQVRELVIGPNQILGSEDPGSRFYYVEHTGAAIEAGRQDLKDMEIQMSRMALEPITTVEPGDVTATERSLDQAETDSTLGTWARALKTGLEKTMAFTAEYLDLDPENAGSVVVNMTFSNPVTQITDIQHLDAMRAGGRISATTYYKELARRDFLSDDFDAEAEMQRVEEETEKLRKQEEDRLAKEKIIQEKESEE